MELLTRRSFFNAFAESVIGLTAVSVAGAIVKLRWPDSFSAPDQDSVTAALGFDRVCRDVDWIVGRFLDAPIGALAAEYQLFWPIVFDQSAIAELTELCSAKEEPSTNPRTWHRAFVLPVIARIHSLPFSTDKDTHREASGFVLDALHRGFILPSRQHRMALDIIWENFQATLIRNQHNWQNFYVDPPILAQAFELCRLSLPDETPRLLAAIAAFQFLLTYACALQERGDVNEWLRVRKMISDLLTRERRRPTWFKGLHEIYHDTRTFQDAPPSQLEVLIGRSNFDSRLGDLFMLARLHNRYIDSEQKIGAPERHTILGEFNISLADWQRLRVTVAPRYFDRPEISFLDDLFATHEKRRDPISQVSGAAIASRLFPFSQHDERTIFNVANSNVSAEKLLERAGRSLDGLVHESHAIIQKETARISGRTDTNLTVSEVQRIIKEEVPPNNLKALEGLIGLFRDNIDSFSSTTAGPPRRGSQSGAMPDDSPNAEIASMTSSNEDLSRSSRPSTSGQFESIESFDPSKIVPVDEDEREFLEMLKYPSSNADNWPDIDYNKLMWDLYQFYKTAPDGEIRRISEQAEARRKENRY